MIIVNCKGNARINNNLIRCYLRSYITSIEYIDNEFNEVLIKEKYYDGLFCYNTRNQLHNPIGPACQEIKINECDSSDEYWINGYLFSKEIFEKIINDYSKW